MNQSKVDLIAQILIIVGALNWLLVGLFSFDLVEAIFGSIPLLMRLVYIVVGICGIYAIYGLVRKGDSGSGA